MRPLSKVPCLRLGLHREGLFEAVWARVSPRGGLAMVHSTLTNAVNRPWLRGLVQPALPTAAAGAGDMLLAGEVTFRFLPAQGGEDEGGDADAATRPAQANTKEEMAAVLAGKVRQLDFEPVDVAVEWPPAGEEVAVPLGYGLIAVELRATLRCAGDAAAGAVRTVITLP
eukprot:SAG22_NODE_6053_length_909_cov_1.207407_1_plen_169_part_10